MRYLRFLLMLHYKIYCYSSSNGQRSQDAYHGANDHRSVVFLITCTTCDHLKSRVAYTAFCVRVTFCTIIWTFTTTIFHSSRNRAMLWFASCTSICRRTCSACFRLIGKAKILGYAALLVLANLVIFRVSTGHTLIRCIASITCLGLFGKANIISYTGFGVLAKLMSSFSACSTLILNGARFAADLSC